MKPFYLTLALMVLSLCMFLSPYAYSEGSFGFSYSRAVDDESIGIHGDIEKDLGLFDLEVEGQLQSGDMYVGSLDISADIGFIRISSNNNLKGFTLGSIGRENVLSLSGVYEVGDYEVSIGVFGRNGNPFKTSYELSDPIDPLSEVIETYAGISMPEGSGWGVSLSSGFNASVFEIDGEVLLDPNDVRHQGNIGIGTGGDLLGNLGWIAKADIIAQSIKEDETRTLKFETSTIFGIDYRF